MDSFHKQSATVAKLFDALCSAKKEMPIPAKTGFNPHYKSHFSTYNDIFAASETPLLDHGLVFLHMPIAKEDAVGVETVLAHVSGEFISASFWLKPVRSTEQDVGKIITYFKRYARAAFLGLEGEIDTDGEPISAKTVYGGSEEQKKILFDIFKRHGVDKSSMKDAESFFLKNKLSFDDIETYLEEGKLDAK